MKLTKQKRRHGFTLVEVLIVVVILGILAATVLPQFTAASSDAKESALVSNLATMRAQIQMYRFQHNGQFPDATNFVAQLTGKTDITGTVNATSGAFGPYLNSLPANPFNTFSTVTAATTDSTPDGLTGWVYNSTTGTIKPNNTGSTPSNKLFSTF